MPITKQKTTASVTSSTYYHALLRVVAIITLLTLLLAVAGSIYEIATYQWVGDTTSKYHFAVLASLLHQPFALIAGGALAYLAVRKKRLSRAEAGALIGSYAVFAGLLLITISQIVTIVSIRSSFPFSPWTDVGEVIATILITGFIAILSRKAARPQRLFMLSLTAIFIGTQLIATTETIIYANRGDSNVMTTDYIWVALELLIPFMLAAVLYLALRNIGRLARAYYSILFVSALIFITSAIGSFLSRAYLNYFATAQTTLLSLALASYFAVFVTLIVIRRIHRA